MRRAGTYSADVDDLDLLALEARTIWGHQEGVLGDGTIAVTALTYDEHVRVIPGAGAHRPGGAVTTSVCRCWQLAQGVAHPPTAAALTAEPGIACRPAGWDSDGWRSLLDGARGPFIAAVANGRVVSLAHCARLTDEAAEVGVQTDAEWTNRGLAAACVCAWAVAMGSERVLFYSAMENNPASHRVAARAGGRPVGRLVRVAAR